MMRGLALLAVSSLCYLCCEAASDCRERIATSYLDSALYMIEKAKNNFPSSCDKNVTRGALDCSELLKLGFNKSGVYTVWPASRVTEGRSLEVYCDMQTDGGGWTLIQRRGNFGRAADYFYKDWKSYKDGFGDIVKDFWLGNDNIFALSNQKLYSARFDLRDVENNTRYAQYDKFWIDDEDHKYALHISGYSGDAGDSMVGHHYNQKFSTKDQDNDNLPDQNCGQLYKGGWWYNGCHESNLNGLYLKGKHESFADGVNWKAWKGYQESMESTEIKIRPKNFKLFHESPNTPM